MIANIVRSDRDCLEQQLATQSILRNVCRLSMLSLGPKVEDLRTVR